KGNADDISYRKTLVNVFVNAIYLYDDKLVIFFNSGDKPVTIDDELLDKTEEGDGFVFGSPCSTRWTLHEHLLFQRRLCRKGVAVMSKQKGPVAKYNFEKMGQKS